VKLLLDSCVWGGAVESLRLEGHDVASVGAWPSDPGDEAILQVALDQGRVVVTLDKDFGELAVARGHAHAGIIRLVGLPARRQAEYCAAAVAKHGADLTSGAILTVTADRVRIRVDGSSMRSG
jgi:predicted nuclease of predicted toxin-antitoxin system